MCRLLRAPVAVICDLQNSLAFLAQTAFRRTVAARPAWLPRAASLLLAIMFLAWACGSASAQQEFEGWNLEPGLSQAHLVMVARVSSISRLTVVEGAKTDVVLREYRFQPVRRLKGIFQRDELSMTAGDLGSPAGDPSFAPPLKEGEFRLLILAQQQGQSLGCVSAAPGATTFDERVPRLSGPDDPLVAVVQTLLQVVDSRSRRERATLLVERLTTAEGLAAVPLLASLQLRADWAAADQRAWDSLARLARDPLPAVRGAALKALRDTLANAAIPVEGRLDRVADTLHQALDSHEGSTAMRLAAIESLGRLLAVHREIDWAPELLIEQLTAAATHAERVVAATALAQVATPEAAAALLHALESLPLDESSAREAAYAAAALRLDAPGAERVLLDRLKRSIEARQSFEAEIGPLGRIQNQASLPLLLDAAKLLNLAPVDRHRIAWALGRLGDDRGVRVLTDWLRESNYQLKEQALAALELLDSQAAAREVRPLLKTEPHLPFKLRIARLLARHGFADGYALATEHLADVGHTADAALVLAALDDPRTANDLSAILAARPDRRWQAAALTGLAAIGDAAARGQLFEILGDERHPLAADGAEAAGLSGDNKLLLPLAALVRSRNKRIALTSLVALRRFFSDVRSSPRGLAAIDQDSADARFTDAKNEHADNDALAAAAADVPPETLAALREAVASLVLDPYVEADLRQQAFAVAGTLRGEQYETLLSDLADQAELEGSPLLAMVQAERRLLNVAKQP